ncbi:MAG: AMP-binding protein [Myxococcales bacterium]|nr:AMP-binding protein [Myxococcales bacterium]
MIPSERYSSLGEFLEDAFIQFKTETALIEANRKRESVRYTYREMHQQVLRVAAWMQAQGVGPESRVAIAMSNQSRWLIGATAALLRGAILVPIDYKLEGKEQLALQAHAKPALLLTEYSEWRKMGLDSPASQVLLSEAPEGMEIGAAIRWEGLEEESFEPAPKPVRVDRRREDIACIVYSSGTGGTPKGCMLSHGAYLEQYRSLTTLFPMTIGDRYFSILPTNHAIDFMCGYIGPLASGATIVHQRALRPELLAHTMKRYGITHMAVVPLILEAFERRLREKLEQATGARQAIFGGLRWLNAALTLDKPRRGLSKQLLGPIHEAFGGELKMLFSGGAFVDADRARFFYELGIPVVIGYGLTEACTVLTVNAIAPFRGDSVGAPLPGVELEIRDADPTSNVGEVWAKSPTLMSGYLDEPEQSEEVLVEGWLRTGDLGYVDPSGHLHLVGRSKNMIVTPGGKNIYPEDIEGAFEGLPCEELAVFAAGYVWPGVELTEERLFAVVREGRRGLREELRRRNRRLPDFKRIEGLLVWDEPFPRTASMKVKRALLAEQLRAQVARDRVEGI